MSRRKVLGPGEMMPPDGWQQSGQLLTQNAVKTVSVQADFPRSNLYTIQFSIDETPRNAGALLGVVYEVEATVIWKVEGGGIQRRFNVGNGTSISAPSQAVQAIIRDVTPAGLLFPNSPYRVSAQVTRGSRPTTGYPPQLLGIANSPVAPLASLPISVPLDAGAISYALSYTTAPASVSSVVVRQLNAAGTIVAQYMTSITDFRFVALFPGAVQVVIDNTDAANTANVSLIWGIDG